MQKSPHLHRLRQPGGWGLYLVILFFAGINDDFGFRSFIFYRRGSRVAGIAELVTWIRAEWGGQAVPVSAGQVSAQETAVK